jgi:hypothetical protein
LQIAFGLKEGAQPDGLHVGLALLSLLAGIVQDEPLLCVIDDRWLVRR